MSMLVALAASHDALAVAYDAEGRKALAEGRPDVAVIMHTHSNAHQRAGRMLKTQAKKAPNG